ncbi:RES domain-containing protein [Novosphingobium umbonatum]|uniref:RES domain-containing protein n=1 Tax=Novosphingobium umbonatum TaxID=1908524 RepID=A0A3S2V9Q7_9SPHN|nr:RES family NAD+ phosphorylase [Novosphingobium umbonatum]RVU02181.1 RES domain-containing protein [Novosphingobium umbonatum]
MLEGLTINREALSRTVRLVTTARLRVPVLLDLVDEDDLVALAEIEGATSNRLLAQNRGTAEIQAYELVYGVPHAAFINASFSYAKPREPSRFNGADRGAWYAALELETSLAEVSYHLTEALAATGIFEATVDYAELYASFAGEFVDLRSHQGHGCLHPDKSIGYPAGNALADVARARGLNGIIYPSVRCSGGTCIAALFPHAVQSVAQGDVYRMTWQGSPVPRIEKVAA